MFIFLPLPHGHKSFLPTFSSTRLNVSGFSDFLETPSAASLMASSSRLVLTFVKSVFWTLASLTSCCISSLPLNKYALTSLLILLMSSSKDCMLLFYILLKDLFAQRKLPVQRL